MPRLIDADKLEPSEVYMNYGFTRIVYMDDIDELPTVDIDEITESHEKIGYDMGFRDGYAQATSEVRHGRWLDVLVADDDEGETDGVECSECGYTDINVYWAKTYHKFCPNCGAKMDKTSQGGF